jgi:hypothetical protein
MVFVRVVIVVGNRGEGDEAEENKQPCNALHE